MPNLLVTRKEAAEKIKTQIEKGHEIRDLNINTEDDLKNARSKKYKWSKYNLELLKHMFSNTTIADEYNRFYGVAISVYDTFTIKVKNFKEDTDESITRLESILERLEIISEGGAKIVANEKEQGFPYGNDIFIVHGHDEGIKECVTRFIEKLGLKAVVLHEKPNLGRTIIEKFEDYSNVGFAIVLMTPDDIGAPAESPEDRKGRSRQNVIFELGYFIGKLGRKKVCVLYKEDVEILSDYQGVLYISMDINNAWKISIAKEIREAGISVDLNKLL
jgi:predicted nucleotide-binding protein